MRIVALVFGIIGGLAGAGLGAKWLADLSALSQLTALASAFGADMSGLSSIRNAAYLLLLALPAGIVGGVFAMRGKGKVGGAVMLVAALLPAAFKPEALVFTSLLVIGGVLALISKPAGAGLPTVAPAVPYGMQPGGFGMQPPGMPQTPYAPPQQGYGAPPQQGYGVPPTQGFAVPPQQAPGGPPPPAGGGQGWPGGSGSQG